MSALRFGPYTNAEPISPHMTSVEALYCALHPPLPASKNRSDFVGLRGDTCSHCTGEVQAGTGISRWYQLRSYHALCKFENIGYVEVPEDHLYKTQNSERSDEVSPYLIFACVQVPVRKLFLLHPVSACYKAEPGTLSHQMPSSCSRQQRHQVIRWLVTILDDLLHLLLVHSLHYYH